MAQDPAIMDRPTVTPTGVDEFYAYVKVSGGQELPRKAAVPVPGTVTASAPLIPDANKDITGLRNLTVTGTIIGAGLSPTDDLTMAEGKNIVVGTATGTKIGGAVTQKVGFWNTTPIVQPSGAAQASGASTTITSVGSTSLTALDVTRLNAAFARIEEVRALTDAMRTALVNAGLIKGAA